MRARVAEMEAEAAKLRELQAGLDGRSGGTDASADGESGDVSMTDEDPATVDARSIYVGNVRSLHSFKIYYC